MASAGLVDLCLELLAPLGPARSRRMFGGHGLYVDDICIALIVFDRLFLKADNSTKTQFEAAGGEPFVYDGKGKQITVNYWTVPADAMESPALMLPWARLAMQAALKARAPMPARAQARAPVRMAARKAAGIAATMPKKR